MDVLQYDEIGGMDNYVVYDTGGKGSLSLILTQYPSSILLIVVGWYFNYFLFSNDFLN